MLEELIHYDKALFLHLNSWGTPTWDGFWRFMTDKWGVIPLYVLLLYVTYRYFGVKKTAILLVFVALLITATDQLANVFKYGVQRLRPCHDPEIRTAMRLVKKGCGGTFGYFSAHAANTTAVACFFVYLLRPALNYLAPLLFVWAALVSYSRIYIGVHFPLDVLTGIGVGLVFGWLFAKLALLALQKRWAQ